MTTEATGGVSDIHSRRPVVLDDAGVEYAIDKAVAE